MARGNWWPGALNDQIALAQNFQGKIGTYAGALPLTPAQVDLFQALCDAIIGSIQFVEVSKETMKAATAWRDLVLFGEPEGDPVGAAPIFVIGGSPAYTRGSVDQFFKARDLILALPGYTEVIGEDLGLIGPEISKEPEAEVAPSLKVAAESGYKIKVSGSMQGYSQLRLEWRRAGTANWVLITFVSNLPAEITIAPSAAGQPENGELRGIFVQKNQEFGNYSPSYPVTIS